MRDSMVKKRIEFIDLAKGICILLVVIGHTGAGVYLPGLQAMRMPLYFILSGLFFKDYGGLFQLLLKKTDKILIPFLFFYISGYLLFYCFEWIVPGMIKSDAQGILDVFTQRQYFNGPIWFLLALFWTNIFFCMISLSIKKEYMRGIWVILIGAIGGLLGINDIFVPMSIDSAMTALPFFYFGYLLKKTPVLYPNKYDKYCLWAAGAFYVCAVCIEKFCNTPMIGFHYNNLHGNWIAIIVVSLSSVMAVLMLCKAIGRLPFVSYFGRYSIIPLCVHHLIYRPVRLLIQPYSDGIVADWSVAVITILICWGCIPLCRKYLPYVTAQKDVLT